MPATATQLPTYRGTDPEEPGHRPDPAAFAAEPDGPLIETVIEPSRGWMAVPWGEMFRQRELLLFLIWRDIKVRYKQAVLGVAWVVLQPIISVIIWTLIFGSGLNLAKQLGAGLEHSYPVFVFAALLPWMLVSRALNEGGLSLVNQQHLLTKIYFPRLFVPTASVGSALFDMLISLPILAALMAIYHVKPTPGIVLLPLLVIQTVLLALGMAYLLAALTVSYRDFRFLIGFIAQIWMYVSFIMIPAPRGWLHKWYFVTACYLNPLYGIVSGYRRVLIGIGPEQGWDVRYLISSAAITLSIFTFGVFFFRRTERRFADIA